MHGRLGGDRHSTADQADSEMVSAVPRVDGSRLTTVNQETTTIDDRRAAEDGITTTPSLSQDYPRRSSWPLPPLGRD